MNDIRCSCSGLPARTKGLIHLMVRISGQKVLPSRAGRTTIEKCNSLPGYLTRLLIEHGLPICLKSLFCGHGTI